ncbi:MAG: hypothetical protein ACI841_003136 [Planctomycetota bacterium]|jgi:hypothetical protein
MHAAQLPPPMSTVDAPQFEEHFSRALDDLRATLTELYLAAGADPEDPQAVSRTFGIHRNLSWKLTRIMRTNRTDSILPYLPGSAGLDLALRAFRQSGAPSEQVDRFAHAKHEFEAMIELHAGDRATLELMLDSSGIHTEGDLLESSRRLAFQGNSGIFGIQARTRLRSAFLAPNVSRPDMVDLAQVSGLIDLRRFRPNACWPLFHRSDFNDDGTPREVSVEAIDTSSGTSSDSMLWPEFCSSPLPEVRVVGTRFGSRYELIGERVGNSALATCVYGGIVREFATRYRDEENSRGEFYADINAPTENLIFDMIVHKEIAKEMELQVRLLQIDTASEALSTSVIPCSETIRTLGVGRPRVSTPLAPTYGRITEGVFKRMGWNAEDFRAWRFEMECPPLPSKVVLSYELPARP